MNLPTKEELERCILMDQQHPESASARSRLQLAGALVLLARAVTQEWHGPEPSELDVFLSSDEVESWAAVRLPGEEEQT